MGGTNRSRSLSDVGYWVFVFSDHNILIDSLFKKALKLTSDKCKRERNFNLTFHENVVQNEAVWV